LLLICLTVHSTGKAADIKVSSADPDFASLSLEELMNYPVTSVSKKEEKLSEAAAAIHVITQEDIRRSGATTIPDALRMVPGMQVAQVDAHGWAISARGFNDVFANKLLVLQDGRSIYTPLFSGVFWDMQDTLLEDIERIEVIRGPGATLWGANAVNGVINIITKKAKDTQGFLVTGGAGTEERGFGAIRYGAKLSDNAHFRIYGKYFSRDDSVLPSGADANDAWQMGRGGFRLDWEPPNNLLTLQGEVYGGALNETFTRLSPAPPFAPTEVADTFNTFGANLLGRWTHIFSADSSMSLQSYYDRTLRDTIIFKEDRDTFDIDFQHRFPLGARQDVVWGLGYRVTSDKVRESDNFDVSLDPPDRTTHLFSAFVQDEIALIAEKLNLTLGSKFEHNDFTGFEFQPSGRLVWTPHERHTFWGAISRAVRTPSRAEDDIRLNQPPVFPANTFFPGSPAAVTSIFGNRDFDSEKLIAYEFGYRLQPHKRLSVDLAAFYNEYDALRSLEPGVPLFRFAPFPPFNHPGVPPPHIAFQVDNKMSGETYGVEIAPSWQMMDWWLWRISYSYLEMDLHTDAGSGDTTTAQGTEGSNPHHQFSLSASIDFPSDVTLDCAVRYVDQLPARLIDSYVVLDIRLAWRPIKNLELSIVGQNLLDDRHPEFNPSFIPGPATEVQHSVYGKVTWRF
jgi:iron complex outermembrane receptor protein